MLLGVARLLAATLRNREKYGGQRGNPRTPEKQALKSPNKQKSVIGAIGVSRALPNNFERAICWLTDHLDDCPRPIIPYIKQAYDLGNMEACEAIRLARLKRGAEAL